MFTEELVERIHETAIEINALFPLGNASKKNHLGDLLLLIRMKKKQINH